MTASGLSLERPPHLQRRDAVIITASVALHLIAATLAPPSTDSTAPPRGPTQVDFVVAPAPPRPAPSPPTAPPRHEPPARRLAARLPQHPAPRASHAAVAAPTPQPTPAEEPVDLTGVTLTDPNGAAWTAAAGNGASRTGTVGRWSPRGSASAPTPTPTQVDDRLVPLADLRQPPRPPELQDALAQQYPADARRDGTPGQAQLRARVRSDGNLDRIRVVVASAPSFGDACRRVLESSRWSPPVGRDGEPCATEIRYVCKFEVTR